MEVNDRFQFISSIDTRLFSPLSYFYFTFSPFIIVHIRMFFILPDVGQGIEGNSNQTKSPYFEDQRINCLHFKIEAGGGGEEGIEIQKK